LKQCAGDYVVTCPSAFHFVLNEGANVAEAMNYPSKERKFYKNPFKRCTCPRLAGYTAIERKLLFIFLLVSKEDMKKEIAMLKEELEKVKAKKEEIEKALKVEIIGDLNMKKMFSGVITASKIFYF
jgi:jumonji domain-containing protein 2